MNKYADIYQYILAEEAAFDRDIDINGWQWNFKQHVKTSFYYKHGRLLNGNDDDTPVKNITRPILNLQYRAEDIELKDISIYVDDPESQHLSFLVKKYHDDVFAVENDLDTFIDEAKESKIDYGAGLIKKGANARPEVVDLQSIAFCDQTDMMKGPIAFKHFFNPAELKDMEAVGWGLEENGATETIDSLITLAEEGRQNDKSQGVKNDTPGAYIEVYEVHGVLPASFLSDEDIKEDGEKKTYKRQFQIVAFYKDKDDEKHGVTLFRKPVTKSPLKVVLRDKIYSRALGFGGAEELFEPQVWTNYDIIRMKDLLDATSKIILKAVGIELKSKYPNGLKNVDNLEIIELGAGEDLAQIDTTPRSMALFQQSVADWENHARTTGSASDPLLGEPSPSGTPFRSQERQVIEGKGLHNYRRGKYAKFLEEVYRDWIIPHITQKITQGTRFLSELSSEEMQYVSDKLVNSKWNSYAIERILNGNVVTKEEEEFFKGKMMEQFARGGNKKFIEILKDEFKRKSLRVKINVAGKQKDLALMTDKLVNIFRQIIANPQGFQQLMQIPEIARTFNDILEYSGISPVYYSGMLKQNTAVAPAQPTTPQLQTSLTPENSV